jgi:formylglycine-generating enzyme required for sulfatase activity
MTRGPTLSLCGCTLLASVFIGGCAVDFSNPPFEDQDGDGVTPALGDCDDANPALPTDGDRDCDYVPTEDDCDDYDPESYALAEDGDCDGVLTDDDCDDGDAGLTAVVDDADCDGVLTADDCDDLDGGVGGAGSVMTESDIEFVCVPGRTFDMGCTPGQSSCISDESPVRTTTLTRDYYMSRTEVTQGQFAAVMGYSPSDFTYCGSTCPVETVSWHEAAHFANAVSAAAGLASCYTCSGSGTSVTCSAPSSVYSCTGYRLPTEAEWEGAARCGEDTRYAGSDTIEAVAWYNSNSGSRTWPVAGLAPNACGLYDMSGNVWEWTNDWYGSGVYGGGAATDPTGPASGSYRVLRGGSWSNIPQYARVAIRSFDGPGYGRRDLGVRLLRTAP